MAEWDEQSGVDTVDSALDPLRMFKKMLGSLINYGGDSGQPGGEDLPMAIGGDAGAPDGGGEGGKLINRVQDDNQTGNRSGGPAGGYQKAPYTDPGQARLKDLMAQEQQMSAPPAKPGFGKRLINAVVDAGPTALAAGVGGAGAAQGADQAMQAGVQRRHQQQDLTESRRQEQLKTLRQQINEEQQHGEQRTFQHGEDQARIEEQEKGLTLRQKIAEDAEDARADRLSKIIQAQGDRQQAGFGQQRAMEDQKEGNREDLEDKKQTGRMQLQMARSRAQAAMTRMRQTMKSIPGPVAKSFDSFQDSQSRMDVMQDAYEKATKKGDQQAMLNLLANHLGMTMGLQKNSRITRDIIREAQESGYLTERIEAHFDKDGYMTGVVLTPRQMEQMVDLAETRLNEDARKVSDMETYFGVQGGMRATPKIPGGPSSAPGTAGGTGGGTGAPNSDSSGELKPPGEAHPGMKWQHRIVNGKIEWRMVKAQGQ